MAEMRTGKTTTEPEHRASGVEDEVGAKHGRDRAARAQVRHPRGGVVPASSVIAVWTNVATNPPAR